MSVLSLVQTLRSDTGRRNPYPLYAELHRYGPASPIEKADGERYQYVVNGYDAVNQVLRDPSFLVTDAAMVERDGLKWREHPCLTALMTSMFFTNEPEHARMRGMYNRVITARRVNGLRAPITAIVEKLLARMAARGSDGSPMDFMTEFAIPMPGDVICELMGVPDENRAWFIPRAHIFGDLLDMGTSSEALLKAADEATIDLTGYFAELIKLRQVEPRDDLIGNFARMQLTDERADEAELLAGLLTFFNAGFASTSHLLGNGMPVLIGRPDIVDAIRDDEAVAQGFVEEVLRHIPPTHIAVRIASEDREVAGVTIPAESMTLVLIGAANFDPARFADPGTFDPFRPDNRPLTFGAGPHFCLGATLTRLEGQVAFPMIFDRFPKLALTGEIIKTNRLTLHGYKSLPITVA